MVCTLLDSCGSYFGEGRAGSKLDRFLTFFQVSVCVVGEGGVRGYSAGVRRRGRGA